MSIIREYNIFFAMLMVFGLIGMVRSLDFIPGDSGFILVNVNNNGDDNLDDLQVKVFIYDFDVLLQTNEFDLDNHDTAGKLLYWNVPNEAKPGDYWARIIVSNDDIKEVTHRLITIA